MFVVSLIGSFLSFQTVTAADLRSGRARALRYWLNTTNSFFLVSFQVIYTTAVRANKYYAEHPVHGAFANHIDPIEIGSQVLIDILLLAKCEHFVHGESSVATLASFFNPDMKLYFIGDVRRDVDHLVVSCNIYLMFSKTQAGK